MDDFQELIKDSVDATTIVSKADHKTELLVSNEHENLFEDSVKKEISCSNCRWNSRKKKI